MSIFRTIHFIFCGCFALIIALQIPNSIASKLSPLASMVTFQYSMIWKVKLFSRFDTGLLATRNMLSWHQVWFAAATGPAKRNHRFGLLFFFLNGTFHYCINLFVCWPASLSQNSQLYFCHKSRRAILLILASVNGQTQPLSWWLAYAARDLWCQCAHLCVGIRLTTKVRVVISI